MLHQRADGGGHPPPLEDDGEEAELRPCPARERVHDGATRERRVSDEAREHREPKAGLACGERGVGAVHRISSGGLDVEPGAARTGERPRDGGVGVDDAQERVQVLGADRAVCREPVGGG